MFLLCQLPQHLVLLVESPTGTQTNEGSSLPSSSILYFPSCFCGIQKQVVYRTIPPAPDIHTHRWLGHSEGGFPVNSVTLQPQPVAPQQTSTIQ